MSRIHEALRKAADEAGDTPTDQHAPLRGAGDAATLSRETFPIEIGEHRRPKPAATSPAAQPQHAPSTRVSGAAPVASGSPERRTAARNDGPIAFERIDGRYDGKIVGGREIATESREQYRRLAASLHHAQAASAIKVVMVTSAVMGEGKTLTASNLALTLSESYQKRVLLVDADLRRPALHTLFRVRNAAGLAEGLSEKSGRKMQLHQLSERLAVLPAGQPTNDPIAGLTSSRMRQLLDEAREAFDWIILDTPPVAMLTDASLLGAMVDGAVIVVKAGATLYDLVGRAVDAVGRDKVLGVVLNSATVQQGASYYNYYYDEPTRPEPEQEHP